METFWSMIVGMCSESNLVFLCMCIFGFFFFYSDLEILPLLNLGTAEASSAHGRLDEWNLECSIP